MKIIFYRFVPLGLLAVFCFPAILSSQNIPNNLFQFSVTEPCPYDSSVLYTHPSQWNAFQTLDSTRWGPIDSSCIPSDVPGMTTGAFIRGGDLNRDLPVYFNAALKSNGSSVALDSNALYKINFSGFPSPFTMWQYGDTCKEEFCSGMELGVEIPDSAGTGTTTRWYNMAFDNFFGGEFCFPTERFPSGNSLSRFWLKMTPNNPAIAPDSARLTFVGLDDMTFSTEKVREMEASFNGFNYEVFLTQFFGNCPNFICPNKMLMYGDTTYPDANHISYVDVNPVPNSPNQEQIEIILDFGTYLIAQPFVELRGGLVQGDTIRHTYNLINTGGNICSFGFAELVFERGNDFTFHDGKISFSDKMGCLMFGRGSTFEMVPGSKLDYGHKGQGMLALRSGGKLILQKDAALTIHNTLIIGDYINEPDPRPIEIELHRGSRLTFAPGSHLSGELSLYPEDMVLTVHMKGGVLDDSELTPQERAMIRKVYDRPQTQFEDNVLIHGNPFGDELGLAVIGEGGENLALEVLDVEGRRVVQKNYVLEEGVNDLRVLTPALGTGVYFLRLQQGEAVVVRRIVKID